MLDEVFDADKKAYSGVECKNECDGMVMRRGKGFLGKEEGMVQERI